MNMKNQTKYKLVDNKLLFEDKPTGIEVRDDHFTLNSEELNLYIEDIFIYEMKRIFRFLRFPTLSNPTGLIIEKNGEIFSLDNNRCIFDEILKKDM